MTNSAAEARLRAQLRKAMHASMDRPHDAAAWDKVMRLDAKLRALQAAAR